jgi:hypothetical protein
MHNKFEETNTLLQTVLKLQKYWGRSRCLCLTFCYLARTPNFLCCWNLVHYIATTYVQLICIGLFLWTCVMKPGTSMMLEPTSTVSSVLCSGMYVDDGLADMCILYELWWECWKHLCDIRHWINTYGNATFIIEWKEILWWATVISNWLNQGSQHAICDGWRIEWRFDQPICDRYNRH